MTAGRLLAAGALGAWAAHAAAAPPVSCLPEDPCQRSTRPGEVSLVFIGDAGYGRGGSSEWGTHAQGEVAARLESLCPRPDRVFFLGDNIYWRGSPDLFAPRFDTVYPRLIGPEETRIRAALGNHDIKGCRLALRPAAPPPLTCADALLELVREDVETDAAGAAPDVGPWVDAGVLEAARAVDPSDCPPAYDRAYEQDQEDGNECFASAALRHAPFGYGLRGGNPLRYYTVDWPTAERRAADPTTPRVRVLVTDSNTLALGGAEHDAPPVDAAGGREDRLQVLWIENQLRTAGPDTWTFLAQHHPLYTPRGCAFKLLGQCLGGHGDYPTMRDQLAPAFGLTGPRAGPDVAPDFVFGAHNHFYARSRALDVTGYPATAPGGTRHFVSGGGGAPLYRMLPLHERFAAGGAFHHFVFLRLRADEAFFWTIDEKGKVRDQGCFRRGESRDGCISRGSYDTDELECEPMPLDALTCAPPP